MPLMTTGTCSCGAVAAAAGAGGAPVPSVVVGGAGLVGLLVEEEEEEEVGGARAGTPWYSNGDRLWSSPLCRSSKLIAHFPAHLAWPRLSKVNWPWIGNELIFLK